MFGLEHAKMPLIQCQDQLDIQPFCHGNDQCIHKINMSIAVLA